MNQDILFINEDTIYYHTSEVLSLALTYQLIHSAGFQCPTISKKARSRRFEQLDIENEIFYDSDFYFKLSKGVWQNEFNQYHTKNKDRA